jgi:hypothetical protein
VSATVRAGCRTFEEDLLRRFEEAGPDAPIPPAEGHPVVCAECGQLVALLNAEAETLRAVAPPRPPVRLLRSLAAPPRDFAARRESAALLDLLASGAIVAPEPSAELMGRLRFLPTRAAARAGATTAPFWRRLLSDWRYTVAAAYAATLVVVTLLGVDPMSAARGAASSLTSAGERAVQEARQTALARLDAAARAEAEKPLTERLDYRIYRTFAEGKARATALAQIAFEKVFGSGTAETAESPLRTPPGGAQPQRDSRPVPTPEPNPRVLRS